MVMETLLDQVGLSPLPNFEILNHYSFKYFFSPTFFSFLFMILKPQILDLLLQFHSSLSSCVCFLSQFSFTAELIFLCCIQKVTDSFLSPPFCCWAYLLSFRLGIHFSVVRFPSVASLFYFFAECFYFFKKKYFSYIYDCLLKHFYGSCLKILFR